MHPMPSALDATEFSRTPRLNSTLCEEPARAASCRQLRLWCLVGAFGRKIGNRNGKRQTQTQTAFAFVPSMVGPTETITERVQPAALPQKKSL